MLLSYSFISSTISVFHSTCNVACSNGTNGTANPNVISMKVLIIS